MMKKQKTRQSIQNPVIAMTALLTGISALPAVAEDHDMEKRIDMLEKELAALKSDVSASETASAKAAKSDSVTFGGYLKADYRHVRGDLAYQDYWRGNAVAEVDDVSHTKFHVKESRINMKYTTGDVSAFVEMDFYGDGGNEIISNSVSPRLRHAYIKRGNWLFGQYWTNFSQLKAFPESLDFGGPMVGEVLIRQPQIRYTHGNFAVSLENPETWGDGDVDTNSTAAGATGQDLDESTPDLTFSYQCKGDWGVVQANALIREVDPGEEDKLALAASIGGRLPVGERDDFRFQLNVGELGRYVGAGMFRDMVTDPDDGERQLEEIIAYSLAYRHFWSDNWRSSVYYGAAESDIGEEDRSHWGINLIRQITPNLTAGVEFGNYSRDDEGSVDADSDYLQMSWKYVL